MENNLTLLTDKYQIAMNAAYLHSSKNEVATFDMFIRKLPLDWGYFIACGIEETLDFIVNMRFEQDDIDYLREWFQEDFLESLRYFRFEGDVWAVKEGTPVFPNQPIMRVTAPYPQAQLVETALLTIINFNTMIASKASRIVTAGAPAQIMDFGLRRAQGGDAGLKASRACYIAGCFATSNMLAGKLYHIPVFGTMAHSFVMSFADELDAFRAFTNTFPHSTTLLIDTYDTIVGAKNAVIIAHELEAKGYRLGAVRLDSGNLYNLAIAVRQILDKERLHYVKITASSDLNEYKIKELVKTKIISSYGVGTEMVTAKPTAAIPGVYKLVEDTVLGPRIKLSTGKHTLPGKKQICREYTANGTMKCDVICLDSEKVSGVKLLEPAIKAGRRIRRQLSAIDIRNYCLKQVASLPKYLGGVKVQEQYPVKLSKGLENLLVALTRE